MRVIYTKAVKIYFGELVDILLHKNYFSFREFADKYVDSLIWELEKTIHLLSKGKAPHYFSRYGKEL